MVNVVVLIPPAVDPGLPPINIKTFINIFELVVNEAISIVLKPAVLAVTEANKDAQIFPGNERSAMA